MVKEILVNREINLQQFLKLSRVIPTGGQSKYFITNNLVFVNGIVENRRSRKLKNGDLVEVSNIGSFRVLFEQEGS